MFLQNIHQTVHGADIGTYKLCVLLLPVRACWSILCEIVQESTVKVRRSNPVFHIYAEYAEHLPAGIRILLFRALVSLRNTCRITLPFMVSLG